MKQIISISAFILMTTAFSASAIQYAWWVTISYEPETSKIFGVPVTEFDPNWELAELLNEAAVPPENVSEFKRDTAAYGYSFTKQGDFNSNGTVENAYVGVYREKSGGLGRFLLILEDIQNKKWTILKSPGRPGFSILALEQNKLAWYFCMECDIISYLVWKNNSYKLDVVEFDD